MRDVLPFLWVMIGALALMTFIPQIVLFLPRLMGYKVPSHLRPRLIRAV